MRSPSMHHTGIRTSRWINNTYKIGFLKISHFISQKNDTDPYYGRGNRHLDWLPINFCLRTQEERAYG